MVSHWLAAVPPANQMPGLKILAKQHGYKHGDFLVIQDLGEGRGR